MAKSVPSRDQIGWRINDWRQKVGGFTRAFVYKLIDSGELETAKIGGARIILTAPGDFLNRHRDERPL